MFLSAFGKRHSLLGYVYILCGSENHYLAQETLISPRWNKKHAYLAQETLRLCSFP